MKKMGAWSELPFDNDDALDWAQEVNSDSIFSDMEALFLMVKEIVSNMDYLESDIGASVIASGYVLLSIVEPDGTYELPDSIRDVIADNTKYPSKELLSKAIEALTVVLSEKSELFSLWEGSSNWISIVKSIIAGLSKHV
jgi:hypothetical protein